MYIVRKAYVGENYEPVKNTLPYISAIMSNTYLDFDLQGSTSINSHHKNPVLNDIQAKKYGTKNIRNTHVLIVDDDLDILDSLRDVIELGGDKYIVKTVNNVRDVKAIVEEFSPDIALIDIKIGQDNGLELVPLLKGHTPDIHCIMMTAYREAEYAVAAVKIGADDYVYKPIDIEKLLSTLERCREQQLILRERDAIDRRFKAVFQQTFQWMLVLDSSGVVLDANQVSLDFIDIEHDAVIGMHLLETPWFSKTEHIASDLKNQLTEAYGKIFSRNEIDLFDSLGNLYTFDISFTPVVDKKNSLDVIIVECRDVTARKETERELLDARINLEKKIEERTRDLARAKEVAENANEAKTRFLSRVSHELRTPMNAVLGFASLMQMQSNLEEDERSYVNEILAAGEHLLDLINEVLDLSRIESDRYHLSFAELNALEVVKESLSLVDKLARDKSIAISVDISSQVITSDAKALKQILVNLLSNAIKYNVEGGKVTISSEMQTSEIIKISIKDTGAGISPSDLDRIFEPFERLDKEYEEEGTGIGLVVVRKLIDIIGGEIQVESEIGQGSVFSLLIPTVPQNKE